MVVLAGAGNGADVEASLRIIGSRALPCGHHRVRLTGLREGKAVRRCPTCKVNWIMQLERSEAASRMTGHAVVRIAWDVLAR